MKRKKYSSVGAILIIVAMLMQLIAPIGAYAEVVAAAPTVGDGSMANPYEIGSAGNLLWISENNSTDGFVGKFFKQTQLIDMTGVTIAPIGTNTMPFKGVYDGDGKTISNLAMDGSATALTGYGLFGYVGTVGTLRNIILENPSVTGAGNGSTYFGILSGYNSGTIAGCKVIGTTASLVSNQSNSMGAITAINAGTIKKCSSTAAVTGNGGWIGGIVGQNPGNIYDCINSGTVTNTKNGCTASGIVAYMLGTNSAVKRCVNVGSLTGPGGASSIATIVDTGTPMPADNYYLAGTALGGIYFDRNGSGMNSNVGCTSKTTGELKQQATYTNWDFTNNWSIDEGNAYPVPQSAVYASSLAITVEPGAADNTTKITLGQSLDTGHSLIIQKAQSSINTPDCGDIGAAANRSAYTSGSDISGVDATTNKYVGVYEVNELGNIEHFNLVTLTSSDIKTPVAASGFSTISASAGTAPMTTVVTVGDVLGASDYLMIKRSSTSISTPNVGAAAPTVDSSVISPYTSGNEIGITPGTDLHLGVYEVNQSGKVVKFSLITPVLKLFENGSGTENDPYIVSSATELSHVYLNPNSYYKQNQDIGMTGITNYIPIGTYDSKFNGTYDGDNHKITNLSINACPDSEMGLFGVIGTGTVKNIILEDVNIFSNNSDDWAFGGIAGENYEGTISNCHVTGNSSIEGVYSVGGIVGSADGEGTIEQCSNEASLILNHSQYNYGVVGGIIGGMWSGGGNVSNCYNTGNISSSETSPGFVGGIVGYGVLQGGDQISNCYNIGTLTGVTGNKIGGVLGDLESGILQHNFFINTPVSAGLGQNNSGTDYLAEAAAKTSTELKDQTTYTGWDFTPETGIWAIDSHINSGYPYLQGQVSGDTADIAAAKNLIPTELTVTEGVYTNLLNYLNGIDGMSDLGVTLTLDSSNANIANSGTITYTGSQVIGNVVVNINKGSATQQSVTILVTVPAHEGGSGFEAPVIALDSVGNHRVTISWEPVEEAVSYSVYKSTVSGSYDSILDTVSSSVYSFSATELTNGTTYYFVVRANFDEGVSGYSNEVSGKPHSTGGSPTPPAPPTPPTTTTTTTTPTTTDSGVNVLVNGKAESAATASTTTNNGQTTTTVTVDEAKIEQKLQREGTNSVITIAVNSKADVVVGELNGQLVKNMESKEAVLEIKADNATYTLPASQINIDAVSSEIGHQVELKDIKVSVQIATPSAEAAQIVENTAGKNNYQVVVKPVEFEITCKSGEKTISVSRFNAYVERTVAIPAGVDPSKITTGIVLNSDGTFSHVPTKIIIVDGKYYAKINSLTNSTYTVIYNPKEFKDVENHWAKNAVNDMGSRLVVSGYEDGTYQPNKDITRAEFAAILVRGLGLRAAEGSSKFSDVKSSDWYAGFVNTAVEYGLIKGFEDGTFRPAEEITREQAMAMIARAMKITKLEAKGETDKILGNFKDSSKVAAYAKDSIAACIKAGVVTGRTAATIAPKANITRAEVAVIVQRLLQKSNMI